MEINKCGILCIDGSTKTSKVFKGIFMDRNDDDAMIPNGSYFDEEEGWTFQPVTFLNESIFRMSCFLQVTRSALGRWTFQVWSTLSKVALKGARVRIDIKGGDKTFGAKLKIMSLLTCTEREGMNSGHSLILSDKQLARKPGRLEMFQYTVKIETTKDFITRLNSDGDVAKDFSENIFNPPQDARKRYFVDPLTDLLFILPSMDDSIAIMPATYEPMSTKKPSLIAAPIPT